MQECGSGNHCCVSIGKQARIRVSLALLPNLLGNEFYFRVQHAIDVINSVIGVIGKERKLIIGENLTGTIRKSPYRCLKVTILEQLLERFGKFNFSHRCQCSRPLYTLPEALVPSAGHPSWIRHLSSWPAHGLSLVLLNRQRNIS